MPEDMTPRKRLDETEENIEQILFEMPVEMQDDYVQALRQTVGNKPAVGGYGQYLGSLAPLVFASRANKLEALRELNRWNSDSHNK